MRARASICLAARVCLAPGVSGEKTFVDYAGQRPALVDPATGALEDVELFVAVPGASNYTCAVDRRCSRSRAIATSTPTGVTRASTSTIGALSFGERVPDACA